MLLTITNKIKLLEKWMNQYYESVNAPYAIRKVFGVQLYKNNSRALLLPILCIRNSDWLQHARGIRGVYELLLVQCFCCYSWSDLQDFMNPAWNLQVEHICCTFVVKAVAFIYTDHWLLVQALAHTHFMCSKLQNIV